MKPSGWILALVTILAVGLGSNQACKSPEAIHLAVGTGGRAGTGGALGTGGFVGTGGVPGSGGFTGTGGVLGTGGTGGMPGIGGAPGTGGAPGSGGAMGTGGAVGSGGRGGGAVGTGGRGGVAGGAGGVAGGSTGGRIGTGGAGGGNCLVDLQGSGYASGALSCATCMDNATSLADKCMAMIDCLAPLWPCSGACITNCLNAAGGSSRVNDCVTALTTAACP